MYQLSKDIGEETNVAEEHPGQVNRLNKAFEGWKDELIEPAFDPLGTWQP